MTSCIILIIAELIIYIIYRIIKSHFKKKQRREGIPYEYIPYEYYNDEEPDDEEPEEYYDEDEEEKESEEYVGKGVILGDSGFYISATKVVDEEPLEENNKSEIPKKTTPTIIQKPTYLELLEKPEWKNKRRMILEERGNKCEWCGSGENLQIHHKLYYKYPNGVKVFPWRYSNELLMCLCDSCHKKYHQKYQVKTYYVPKNYYVK